MTGTDHIPSPQSTPAAPAALVDPAVVDEDNLDKLPLMHTTVIIAIVMLLKAYLKSLYSLSEEYVPHTEI